ncbi:MAG: hypothetical protein ETSY1_46900 (plasmid) [Candidatus Entotheonella factor]|uniref:Uncharacterized protein n=1 Tax=Entotheonella factor TaxID=1429438 RepID=W4LZM1_ENTF1|nr:MAG: hypothetical protein ETSY1_46900 [Candidatus Entotheonella factor]
MLAVEFQAKIIDGRIEIPQAICEQFTGDVNVILFAEGADHDPAAWPQQNRRRWELIATKVRQGLTEAEEKELTTLQQRANEQLAQVGPRPVEHLERLYAELSEQG